MWYFKGDEIAVILHSEVWNTYRCATDVDKTDNMLLLLNRYNNEVNELKKFINVIDYYTNYMNTVTNYYRDIYTDYDRKLVNNLMDIGGGHGKNRF